MNATTGNATQESSTPTWTIYALIAIFAFLFYAVVLMPKVRSDHGNPKRAAAQSDLMTLSDTVQQFKLNCGRYPTTEEGLDALRHRPRGAHGWKGPYLTKEVLRDPWANAYVYSTPGPNGAPFMLESYGADGKPGGEDENTDIVITN